MEIPDAALYTRPSDSAVWQLLKVLFFFCCDNKIFFLNPPPLNIYKLSL